MTKEDYLKECEALYDEYLEENATARDFGFTVAVYNEGAGSICVKGKLQPPYVMAQIMSQIIAEYEEQGTAIEDEPITITKGYDPETII